MKLFFNRFKLKKKVLAAVATAGLMAGSVVFAALPDIIHMEDIKPGMTGKGYTVVDSSGEIRSFDVKVTGRLGGGKMETPRILIDISGPLIEETGGAISGMSGSPIYIEGKLAGALSASIKEMHIDKGIMVTPIDAMLKIWEYPDSKNKTMLPTVDVRKSREEAEQAQKDFDNKVRDIKVALNKMDPKHFPEIHNPNLADNLKDEWNNPNLADNLRDAYPANKPDDEDKGDIAPTDEVPGEEEPEKVTEADGANGGTDAHENKADDGEDKGMISSQYVQDYTPESNGKTNDNKEGAGVAGVEEKALLLTSGFSQRGVDFMQDILAQKGFRIQDVGEWNSYAGAHTVDYNATLAPGSSVGVAAAVGDYSIGAIGTVTAVDDKRILAFGHPFSHRGNVNYFMTGSDVISTVHGPLSGMKLGSNSSLIGRINQDREDGIAGILGVFPQNIPVAVTINDVDLAKSVTYNSMVAFDEELIPALSTAMVYDAMSKTVNRGVNGTARVHFAVRTNMGENGLVERTNMFYNGSDVGKPAVSEITEIMNTICNNKEREADIYDIKVDVFIEGKRMTASLLSATPSKNEVLPGEDLIFSTTVKPYRGEKVVLEVPYTVPRNQLPGTLNLDIHGGGLVNVAKLLLAQQGGDASLEEDKSIQTEAILKDMVESSCNNDIVIEPAVAAAMTEAQQKEAIRQAIKQAKRAEKEAKKALEDARNGKKADKPAKTVEPVSRFATDYIIDNVIHTSVRVVEKKD